MSDTPQDKMEQALIKGALDLFGHTCSQAFKLPIPNTTPQVYLMSGTESEIASLCALPEALRIERDCSRGGKHSIDQCHKCGAIITLPSPLARKCRHGYREENCGLCRPELEPKETPQSGA